MAKMSLESLSGNCWIAYCPAQTWLLPCTNFVTALHKFEKKNLKSTVRVNLRKESADVWAETNFTSKFTKINFNDKYLRKFLDQLYTEDVQQIYLPSFNCLIPQTVKQTDAAAAI